MSEHTGWQVSKLSMSRWISGLVDLCEGGQAGSWKVNE